MRRVCQVYLVMQEFSLLLLGKCTWNHHTTPFQPTSSNVSVAHNSPGDAPRSRNYIVYPCCFYTQLSKIDHSHWPEEKIINAETAIKSQLRYSHIMTTDTNQGPRNTAIIQVLLCQSHYCFSVMLQPAKKKKKIFIKYDNNPVQNALGATHSLSVLCKQGTNPNNFAHKVELNFSLQSKPPCLSQRSAFTKAHCSYHLKCEPTAHSASYTCVYINNAHSQEQHHHLFTLKIMNFLVLGCLTAYLWPA